MNGRFLLSLAACLAASLPGCFQAEPAIEWAPEPPWVASPCDTLAEPSISYNAPKAGPFAGSVEDLVESLAKAFGDALSPSRDRVYKTGDQENGAFFYEWATQHGRIVYEHRPQDGNARLRYEAERVWPAQREAQGAAELRSAFERLGLLGAVDLTFEVHATSADGVTRSTAVVTQWFEGRPLTPPVLRGDAASEPLYPGGDPNSPFYSQVHLEPVHDLSKARIRINATEATERARQFFACMNNVDVDQAVLRGETGLAVVHESLTHVVQLTLGAGLGCREVSHVFVDAETGAIHGQNVGGGICID